MMNQAQLTDPCQVCAWRVVCDPDECGRKLYELDSNKPPKSERV